MKRIVNASKDFNSQLTEYDTYTRNRQKFAIHSNSAYGDPNDFKAQITEIHPYDDADYAWARIGARGAMEVEFIKDGRILEKMQLHYYDDEDYENLEQYFDDIIDTVCVELRSFNKYVKPKMIHN